jgi:hypothetical protein
VTVSSMALSSSAWCSPIWQPVDVPYHDEYEWGCVVGGSSGTL